MTVRFKRIGLKDDTNARFQSNVEQAFHELNDILDATPTKLYGTLETTFAGGAIASQDTPGFSVATDGVGTYTITLNNKFSKLLLCSWTITGENFGTEALAVTHVSNNISSGGKQIVMLAQGATGPTTLETGTQFIEITLRN